MIIDPKTEWKKFRDSLVAELKLTPIGEFEEAWQGLKNKTEFYGSKLLVRVAHRNQWEIWNEFLRCDFALANSDGIPIIFIESENNHASASEEIEKLCCIAAPVKVLFLSCEWFNSERQAFIDDWLERIRRQHSALPFDCMYMFVVGEWGRGDPDDGILRYYLESFDPLGQEIEPRLEIEIPNKTDGGNG